MVVEPEYIEIAGAREHNLQNLDLRIPRNKLVVITGISGSGKSSLAFDTIYAEGQRRYMDTFSSYARQFIGSMEKPDVEYIAGLSPVISIEQKTTSKNPRSTVGTVTEILDFLRLLFARIGEAHSYVTGKKMVRYSEVQMIDHVYEHFTDQKITILAPLIRGRKGHYRELFDQIRKQGFLKVRVNGVMQEIVPNMQLERFKTHDIEVVIDRIQVLEKSKDRLRTSMQTALKSGSGMVMVLDENEQIFPYSKYLMDPETGISYEEPSPNTFSFNSPYGACTSCNGLGTLNQIDIDRVIPDDSKSINEIGIAPLGEVRQNNIFEQLRQYAKLKGFSFSTPVKDIPEDALRHILYGGDKDYKPSAALSKNEFSSFNLPHEGLLNMLQRWYRDSTSDNIRAWAEEYMTIVQCSDCNGTRLRKESLSFKIADRNIGELCNMDVRSLHDWIGKLPELLNNKHRQIATEIIKEIGLRLGFLLNVGLEYLSLNRPSRTLSGGESQRIRLATQIGSQLTGITYILDEPSIGLHQRDNMKLIQALRELTDIGNSILVVEHDKDIMMCADYIIDLGPGAGKHGGMLVGEGTPEKFLSLRTLTSEYLSNSKSIDVPKNRRKGNGHFLEITGASGNNLKNVNIKIPLGTFVCVTGVSGSGKSTLINDTLYPILRKYFYKSKQEPLAYKKITGLENLDKVIEIDQAPIGRTPRSNPVTYTNVFGDIRKIFAELPESKIRGYKPGRFSFNVKGGRCEECQGGGMKTIEMNFLPDVQVECDVCMGRRYNRETLEVLYKGKSINDVLNMTVEEAVLFFESYPSIHRKIKTLQDVGLSYISLGQAATTLSGGEAQRVKLSEELSKKDTGKTIYILDEPTTGLHFEDIKLLLGVLNKLVDKGNTVLIIEHNMDVIKTVDYIIDIGPEGGDKGGSIVCTGTPEQVAANKSSYTGEFLKKELN